MAGRKLKEKPGGSVTKLQADGIIAAALGLMNEVGLDMLTMRRLADRLGVQAPALYWHFRSKKALLDAMLDTLLAGNLAAPEPGEDPGAWLSRIGHRLRGSLLRYQDAARLVTQVQLTPRMIEVRLPRFYDGFKRMGIEGPAVLYSSIAFVAFIVGWVQTEQNMRSVANARSAEPQLLSIHDGVVSVPGFDDMDLGAAFEHGLALMINGCRAYVPDHSAST